MLEDQIHELEARAVALLEDLDRLRFGGLSGADRDSLGTLALNLRLLSLGADHMASHAEHCRLDARRGTTVPW